MRLAWVQWQQPTYLLKLATYAHRVRADLRLIDAMHAKTLKALPCQRAELRNLEGVPVQRWRFGLSQADISEQMQELDSKGKQWRHDKVFIECFTTFWWEGAVEMVAQVRREFPAAAAVLVGVHAELAADHAKRCTEPDYLQPRLWPQVNEQIPDLAGYGQKHNFACVSLAGSQRSAGKVLAEVRALVKEQGVYHCAFSDEDIAAQDTKNLYLEVMVQLASKPLKVRFCAFGNIKAHDLLETRELASLIRAAGYKQINFADGATFVRNAGCNSPMISGQRYCIYEHCVLTLSCTVP